MKSLISPWIISFLSLPRFLLSISSFQVSRDRVANVSKWHTQSSNGRVPLNFKWVWTEDPHSGSEWNFLERHQSFNSMKSPVIMGEKGRTEQRTENPVDLTKQYKSGGIYNVLLARILPFNIEKLLFSATRLCNFKIPALLRSRWTFPINRFEFQHLHIRCTQKQVTNLSTERWSFSTVNISWVCIGHLRARFRHPPPNG